MVMDWFCVNRIQVWQEASGFGGYMAILAPDWRQSSLGVVSAEPLRHESRVGAEGTDVNKSDLGDAGFAKI